MYDFETSQVPSARDFVERELKAEPTATYPEIRERAARIGLNVPPFLYGATRRNLGLPPRPEPALEPAAGSEPADSGTDDAAESAGPAAAALESEPHVATTTLLDEAAVPPATEERQPQRTKDGKSAFDFAVEMLKLTPEISFQDLRDRARLAGLKLPPIVYGRAKALLGLVPTKPRRPRETAPAPRMLRQVDSAQMLQPMPDLEGVRQVEQLVATLRLLEGENRRLKAAVEAALAAVEAALAERADG